MRRRGFEPRKSSCQPRFHLEEGGCNQPCYTAVRALGVENGPLDRFKQALEQLQIKMTSGGTLKKVGNALAWKFSKEGVARILARIEHLKSLVQVALQMDHLSLSLMALQDEIAHVS